MRPPPSTSLDSVCHISYLSSEEAWSYFLTNVKPQLYLDSLAPALLNARRSNESLVPLHASPLFEYINLDQAEAGINKDPLKMHLEPLFHMNICVVEDLDHYRNVGRPLLKFWKQKSDSLERESIFVAIFAASFPEKQKTALLTKIKTDLSISLSDKCFSIFMASAAKSAEYWDSVRKKFSEVVSSAYQTRLLSLDESIRKLDAQRVVKGWSLSRFFVYKECLAFTYLMFKQFNEALVLYEELASLINQKACASYFPTLFPSQLPFSELSLGYFNAFQLSLMIKEGKGFFVDLRAKIISSTITLFEFRLYLFYRQIDLLLELGDFHLISFKVREFLSELSSFYLSQFGLSNQVSGKTWAIWKYFIINLMIEEITRRNLNMEANFSVEALLDLSFLRAIYFQTFLRDIYFLDLTLVCPFSEDFQFLLVPPCEIPEALPVSLEGNSLLAHMTLLARQCLEFFAKSQTAASRSGMKSKFDRHLCLQLLSLGTCLIMQLKFLDASKILINLLEVLERLKSWPNLLLSTCTRLLFCYANLVDQHVNDLSLVLEKVFKFKQPSGMRDEVRSIFSIAIKNAWPFHCINPSFIYSRPVFPSFIECDVEGNYLVLVLDVYLNIDDACSAERIEVVLETDMIFSCTNYLFTPRVNTLRLTCPLTEALVHKLCRHYQFLASNIKIFLKKDDTQIFTVSLKGLTESVSKPLFILRKNPEKIKYVERSRLYTVNEWGYLKSCELDIALQSPNSLDYFFATSPDVALQHSTISSTDSFSSPLLAKLSTSAILPHQLTKMTVLISAIPKADFLKGPIPVEIEMRPMLNLKRISFKRLEDLSTSTTATLYSESRIKVSILDQEYELENGENTITFSRLLENPFTIQLDGVERLCIHYQSPKYFVVISSECQFDVEECLLGYSIDLPFRITRLSEGLSSPLEIDVAMHMEDPFWLVWAPPMPKTLQANELGNIKVLATCIPLRTGILRVPRLSFSLKDKGTGDVHLDTYCTARIERVNVL